MCPLSENTKYSFDRAPQKQKCSFVLAGVDQSLRIPSAFLDDCHRRRFGFGDLVGAVRIRKNQREPPAWLLIHPRCDLAQLLGSGYPGANLDLHDNRLTRLSRNQIRVEWKEFVAEHARLAMDGPRELASDPVALRLLYVYEEAALDIDNILKPIQDALVGVLLEDDSVITDVEIRRGWLRTTFTVNGPNVSLH